MKSMHSIAYEFLDKITLMADAELMRCETDFDEEKISELAGSISLTPEYLLSEDLEPSLIKVAKIITDSGATNGYPLSLNDILGILFMWRMISIITKNVPSSMSARNRLNFFNDLADHAGYHVQMFAEDAINEHYLAYFNDKIPDYFTHSIEENELILIYYFYVFGSKYLEWQDEKLLGI